MLVFSVWQLCDEPVRGHPVSALSNVQPPCQPALAVGDKTIEIFQAHVGQRHVKRYFVVFLPTESHKDSKTSHLKKNGTIKVNDVRHQSTSIKALGSARFSLKLMVESD